MHGFSARRILLLAAATASLGWGQTTGAPPAISTLQSAPLNCDCAFSDVTGITSGTALSNGGFELVINGAFTANNFVSVRWLNTSTNVATLFTANNGVLFVGATQIAVAIPNALFQTLVATPVPVTVTVQEVGQTSNAALFTILPPLQSAGPILPIGTINHAYSADLTTGGTLPNAQVSGTLPPGSFRQTGALLSAAPPPRPASTISRPLSQISGAIPSVSPSRRMTTLKSWTFQP